MSNVRIKARQFVNLVTEKYSGDWYARRRVLGSYSLRRVKARDLFYGSTEEALQKEAEQEAMAAADPCTKVLPRSRLPRPRIKFNQSRPVDARMDFWPIYGATESEKILCVDAAGQTVLYDADAVTLETLPRLREPMGSELDPAIALSVALPDAHDPARPDALYVMDETRGSFEALVYGDPSPYLVGRRFPHAFVWRWRQLPMPPFVREPNYGSIASYALLPADDGGSNICVSFSTDSQGTYCFNTARERWTKAGRWSLPFYRRAQIVPELNGFCFGVASRYPNHLCAVDLTSSISADGDAGTRRPKLWYQWPVMDKPDSSWTPTSNISMAYMGAGRFCIAKTFSIREKDTGRCVDDETVLSGVEVVPETTSKWRRSKLHMIRHKSVRYGLLNHRIHVL